MRSGSGALSTRGTNLGVPVNSTRINIRMSNRWRTWLCRSVPKFESHSKTFFIFQGALLAVIVEEPRFKNVKNKHLGMPRF